MRGLPGETHFDLLYFRGKMKTLRCYVDTSVFNFVLADDEPGRQRCTKDFFDEAKNGQCEAFISDLVIEEIGRTKDPKRSKLLALLSEIKPVRLETGSAVDELVERYMDGALVPVRFRDDAVHIAVAVVNDLDVVVSWNLEHMVKLRTRTTVNAINRLNGYKEIEICTPEEVVGS